MRMLIKLKQLNRMRLNVFMTMSYIAGYNVDTSLSYTVHTSLQDGSPIL